MRASRSCNWGYHELIEIDLEAALKAAVELSEGKPIWLSGHSLGSQLCCLVAARHPARAAGLVLIAGGAPYVRVFPWPLRLALNFIFRTIPPMAHAVGYYPGKRLGFAGTEARWVMRDWARTGLTGSYDLPSLAPGQEARLAELAVPVLAVRMSEDWFVPPESLESLLFRLRHGRIDRMVIDPGQQGAPTDHFRWLKSPGATASAVSDWLDAPNANGQKGAVPS